MKLIDVCEHLEDTARTLVGASGLDAGERVRGERREGKGEGEGEGKGEGKGGRKMRERERERRMSTDTSGSE